MLKFLNCSIYPNTFIPLFQLLFQPPPPRVSPFTRYFLFICFTVLNLKQPLEAPNRNDDYGDTVPSRLYNIGLQVANEVLAPSTLRKQQISDGTELGGEGMRVLHLMS